MNERDYVKERVDQVSFAEAAEMIQSGWVAARDGWPAGTVVFMAREGTFTAADLVTGQLEPFLVKRAPTGRYVPWQPDHADVHGRDWICITRQTFSRQLPLRNVSDPHQRDTKRVAVEDYKADGETNDMA